MGDTDIRRKLVKLENRIEILEVENQLNSGNIAKALELVTQNGWTTYKAKRIIASHFADYKSIAENAASNENFRLARLIIEHRPDLFTAKEILELTKRATMDTDENAFYMLVSLQEKLK